MAKWDRSRGRPEPIRALNRIPELENHEPLVDMREVCPSIRLARDSVIPYARKRVAEMAERAARRLPKGYVLGLAEAWRPFERQQRIYEFMLKSAREAWPDRDFKSLRRTVCRWVAPTDQKAPPGHCTGAALDVWLLDEKGEQVDVWSPITERFNKRRPLTHWGGREAPGSRGTPRAEPTRRGSRSQRRETRESRASAAARSCA